MENIFKIRPRGGNGNTGLRTQKAWAALGRQRLQRPAMGTILSTLNGSTPLPRARCPCVPHSPRGKDPHQKPVHPPCAHEPAATRRARTWTAHGSSERSDRPQLSPPSGGHGYSEYRFTCRGPFSHRWHMQGPFWQNVLAAAQLSFGECHPLHPRSPGADARAAAPSSTGRGCRLE